MQLYSLEFLHSHWHLLLFQSWFQLNVLPSNLHLHLHDIFFADIFNSFIPVIILKALKFKSSVLFGTHIILDRSLIVFTTYNVMECNPSMYSLGCKLIRVDWVMQCWLFKDIHFVESEVLTMLAKDLLKRNNPINTCLISPDIILYYF